MDQLYRNRNPTEKGDLSSFVDSLACMGSAPCIGDTKYRDYDWDNHSDWSICSDPEGYFDGYISGGVEAGHNTLAVTPEKNDGSSQTDSPVSLAVTHTSRAAEPEKLREKQPPTVKTTKAASGGRAARGEASEKPLQNDQEPVTPLQGGGNHGLNGTRKRPSLRRGRGGKRGEMPGSTTRKDLKENPLAAQAAVLPERLKKRKGR